MIKRCPTCSRTYSDESISFCLADGTLLSAPLNEEAREPPPTEILPPSSSPVPPTKGPTPAVPTLTSPTGAHKYSPLPDNKPNRRYQGLIWLAIAIVAIVVVAVLVIGGFAARRIFTKKADALATSSPELPGNPPASGITNENLATSSSPVVSKTTMTPPPTVSSTVSQPTPPPKSSPSPTAAQLDPDPALFPPNTRNLPYGTPSPGERTDYSRVFGPREVDTKLQFLSKPAPSYTDAARQNNVQGTVVLRVVFSADGSVGSVTAVSGLPYGLTEQAIAAARKIRFTPAIKDGRPVSVSMLVQYNFSVY